MLDRASFVGWTYRQPGNQCVLAAYAAAMWPGTSQVADMYFSAYCLHFGLAVGVDSPETVYDADFRGRAAATPGGGFGVIHCLHRAATETAFATARSVRTLRFFPDGSAGWPEIDLALRSVPDTTAQVFINDNPGSPFARMHSVCLAIDANGLYAYDSNPPGQLVSLPSGKSQLGLLGHAFLVAP